MKTKVVDGIRYVSKPALKGYDPSPYFRTVYYCCGCVGQHNAELCEKLQECYNEGIVWVSDEPTYEI